MVFLCSSFLPKRKMHGFLLLTFLSKKKTRLMVFLCPGFLPKRIMHGFLLLTFLSKKKSKFSTGGSVDFSVFCLYFEGVFNVFHGVFHENLEFSPRIRGKTCTSAAGFFEEKKMENH